MGYAPHSGAVEGAPHSYAHAQGLSSRQKAVCDKFVYIPQYGSGTASLNVAVACSIVLHHFAVWAQYEEQTRQGEKFVVAERDHTGRQFARGALLSCMVFLRGARHCVLHVQWQACSGLSRCTQGCPHEVTNIPLAHTGVCMSPSVLQSSARSHVDGLHSNVHIKGA